MGDDILPKEETANDGRAPSLHEVAKTQPSQGKTLLDIESGERRDDSHSEFSISAVPPKKEPAAPSESMLPTSDSEKGILKTSDVPPLHYLSLRTLFMGLLVSMGGLIFGYGGIGQIGGFLQMPEFRMRFADEPGLLGVRFSDVRAGTIVSMVSLCFAFHIL
jgi:hypothetical protein